MIEVSKINNELIGRWKNLKSYSGFKLLVDELNEIIKEAEMVIFATGADHKPMYSDRDMAIVKRDNAMRIKGLPDLMISQLSGTGEMRPENPDAFQDVNEITEDDFSDDILQDDF